MKKIVIMLLCASMILALTSCATVKTYETAEDLILALNFSSYIPEYVEPKEYKSVGKDTSVISGEYFGETYVFTQSKSKNKTTGDFAKQKFDNETEIEVNGLEAVAKYTEGGAGLVTWQEDAFYFSVYTEKGFYLDVFQMMVSDFDPKNIIEDDTSGISFEVAGGASSEKRSAVTIQGNKIDYYDYYTVKQPEDGVLVSMKLAKAEGTESATVDGIYFYGEFNAESNTFECSSTENFSGDAVQKDGSYIYSVQDPYKDETLSETKTIAVGADMFIDGELVMGTIVIIAIEPR